MRKLTKGNAVERIVAVEGDVVALLRRECAPYEFLLAHCEGGVVWGRVSNGTLILAPDGEALMNAATLQEARLFGRRGELHVWRSGDAKFRGRALHDVDEPGGDGTTYVQLFDEEQVLWGDHRVREENGFSLMEDGGQGLRHWAPITLNGPQRRERRLRLHVRNYVTYGADRVARVAAARLTSVSVTGG